MTTPVFRLGGVDITEYVEINGCRLVTGANGHVGEATIPLRDKAHELAPIIGQEFTLDIDGIRVWGGFVMRTPRRFYFEGSTGDPEFRPRQIVLQCLDYNLLLSRRVLADYSGDPARPIIVSYDPGTDDDVIIKDVLENYADLSGDGLDVSTYIEHVGTPSQDSAIDILASWTLKDLLTNISRDIGSIFYIDPDKNIVYTDVDTPTDDEIFSDSPGGPDPLFEDSFARVGSGIGDAVNYAVGEENNSSTDGDALVQGGVGYTYSFWDWLSAPKSGEIWYDFFTGDNSADLYIDVDSAWTNVADDIYYLSTWFYSNGDGTWEVGGYGGTPPDENKISNELLDSGTWYRVRAIFVPGEYWKLKFWKRSDPQPTEWFYEGVASVKFHSPGAESVGFIELDTGGSVEMMADNLQTYEAAKGPGSTPENEVGCRDLEIDFGGEGLVNDALNWGAGQGSPQMVFNRTTDDASIAEHGVWQGGSFRPSIFRQATIDRISDSMVYGSPQNRRGGKDDAISVKLTTFTPRRVANKHTVRSYVFDYEDVLPLRSETITFPKGIPVFELTLSHEIDAPWSTFEWLFNFDLPDFEIPEIALPQFDACLPLCIYEDTFGRDVGAGWGEITSETGWEVATSGGSEDGLSVDGARGLMFHRDLSDGYWTGTAVTLRDIGTATEYPLNNVAADNIEVEFDFTLPSVRPDFGAVDVRLAYPLGTSGVNWVGLRYGTMEPVQLRVARSYLDGTFQEETADTSFPWHGGRTYRVKLRVDSTTTYAKVWVRGTSEPATWTISVTPGSGSPVTGQPPFLDFLLVTESQALTNPSTVKVDNACLHEIDSGTVGGAGGSSCIGDFDSFSRLEPTDLGQSDLGIDYEYPDGSVAMSVDGSKALFGQTGGRQAVLVGTDLPLPIDVLIRLKQTGDVGTLFDLGFIDSFYAGSFYGEVQFKVTSGPTPSLYVFADNGGGADGDSVDGEGSVDEYCLLRARVESDRVVAKVWVDGQPEPQDYQVEVLMALSVLDGNNDVWLTGVGSASHDVEVDYICLATSDPCADPETAPPVDPPSGYTCETLVETGPPPGYSASNSYWQASTAITPGTERVTVDGLFLRPGIDYSIGDAYYGGFIAVVPAIDTTGKTVYMCYDADPERGLYVP